jgi:membrane protein
MEKSLFTDARKNITPLARYLSGKHIGIYAAGAGYFIVLSVFPLLVLILSLLRYTGLEVQTLTNLVSGFVPEALMPSAKRLILSTYHNTSGAVISLSAITGLWSASRGVYGLLTGLNRVYGVSEDRGWLQTRFISVAYTFAFLAVLLLTLVIHVFGGTILALLPISRVKLIRILGRIIDFRFWLLLIVQTLVFMLLFAFLPNGRNKLRDTVPGAILASLGWLVISWAFSLYVAHFASLTNIFGSVYTLALAMLWLYFCLCLIFYSAALNQYLTQRKK